MTMPNFVQAVIATKQISLSTSDKVCRTVSNENGRSYGVSANQARHHRCISDA
jgi:hypothetical protein